MPFPASIFRVSSRTVSVLRPRKSNLTRPDGFRPFHAELHRRDVGGAAVPIERGDMLQRPVGDHDARRVGRGVAVQSFELEREMDELADGLVFVPHGLERRFVGDRICQLRRIGRIVRDQFADPVHLAERHTEYPADIAQRGAGLQLAECDDLRHPVMAVALLDMRDHLVATVLAEVDIEIRHRDALGIEKALEQQPPAQRIEVRNLQGPGDDGPRARSRAPARPECPVPFAQRMNSETIRK